jgi:hypothetical protein
LNNPTSRITRPDFRDKLLGKIYFVEVSEASGRYDSTGPEQGK